MKKILLLLIATITFGCSSSDENNKSDENFCWDCQTISTTTMSPDIAGYPAISHGAFTSCGTTESGIKSLIKNGERTETIKNADGYTSVFTYRITCSKQKK